MFRKARQRTLAIGHSCASDEPQQFYYRQRAWTSVLNRDFALPAGLHMLGGKLAELHVRVQQCERLSFENGPVSQIAFPVDVQLHV
jgi:hypothetical protein